MRACVCPSSTSRVLRTRHVACLKRIALVGAELNEVRGVRIQDHPWGVAWTVLVAPCPPGAPHQEDTTLPRISRQALHPAPAHPASAVCWLTFFPFNKATWSSTMRAPT